MRSSWIAQLSTGRTAWERMRWKPKRHPLASATASNSPRMR